MLKSKTSLDRKDSVQKKLNSSIATRSFFYTNVSELSAQNNDFYGHHHTADLHTMSLLLDERFAMVVSSKQCNASNPIYGSVCSNAVVGNRKVIVHYGAHNLQIPIL